MYQKFPHMNFPIGEITKLSYMFGLYYTGALLNLGNMDYHQSVSEIHPYLVLKFAYLKDLNYVGPFNISRIDRVK